MKTKRKLFKVIMIFDMSWGPRAARTRLSKRTYTPRSFVYGVRTYGYYARNRFIPATRLIEAYIVEIKP